MNCLEPQRKFVVLFPRIESFVVHIDFKDGTKIIVKRDVNSEKVLHVYASSVDEATKAGSLRKRMLQLRDAFLKKQAWVQEKKTPSSPQTLVGQELLVTLPVSQAIQMASSEAERNLQTIGMIKSWAENMFGEPVKTSAWPGTLPIRGLNK